MQRVRIKIEGLCDPDQAVRIASMGADAIGLVFAESPRQVSPERAREITDALPVWVSTVGVFVNASADAINRIVEQTRINYVQLHGDEGPEIVGRINAPCVKAFRIKDDSWVDQVQQWLAGVPDSHRKKLPAVLLDAFSPEARGGTGRKFNWDMVARARADGKMDSLGPIILAGGLDAACVAGAIEIVKPWAVDVASGVEKSPGQKDLQKVQSFIQNVAEC